MGPYGPIYMDPYIILIVFICFILFLHCFIRFYVIVYMILKIFDMKTIGTECHNMAPHGIEWHGRQDMALVADCDNTIPGSWMPQVWVQWVPEWVPTSDFLAPSWYKRLPK